MARTESQLRNRLDDHAEAEEIRRDINRTRCEMDETIDRLSERLTPRHLVDEVLDLFRTGDTGDARESARQTVQSFSRTAVRQLKDHPVPALLIGVGLAWMMAEDDERTRMEKRIRRNNREPQMYSGSYVDARTGEPYDDSYGEEFRHRGAQTGERESAGMMERAEEMAGRAGETLSGAGHSLRETASGVADKIGEWSGRAGDMAGQVGEWASHTRHRVGHMGHQVHSGYQTGCQQAAEAINEYPLAVGFGVLALGALVGLALPNTRREDELLGEQSDDLKHRARAMGQDALERGRHAVQSATATIKDDMAEEGLTTDDLGESLHHIAGRTIDAAQEAVHGVVNAATEAACEALCAANEAAHEEGIAPSDLAEKAMHVARHAQETVQDEFQHQTNPEDHA